MNEWERRNDEHHKRERDKHYAKRKEIEDAILAGENEKAVRLLNAYEA